MSNYKNSKILNSKYKYESLLIINQHINPQVFELLNLKALFNANTNYKLNMY